MGQELCLIAGPVASLVVQFAKGLSLVQRYPKVILALLTGAYSLAMGTGWECWIGAFASGIAGYEVIVKPLSKRE